VNDLLVDVLLLVSIVGVVVAIIWLLSATILNLIRADKTFKEKE